MEINKSIARLKASKSPGTDGYTSEWYKSFREQIVPRLQTACNWALQKGEIPPSWREATITIIPKDAKDKLECKNYRPISVLNIDYKIYTSILAKRMETILPNLIQLDQTGFITLHTLWHIQHHKISSMFLGLDTEKAFDTVRY